MKTTEQIVTELKENIKFRISLYGYNEIKSHDSYTYGLIDTLKFIIGKEQAFNYVRTLIKE